MREFELKWSETPGVVSPYPGVTVEGRLHTYTFKVGDDSTDDDVENFIKSFKMITGYRVQGYVLTELENEEK